MKPALPRLLFHPSPCQFAVDEDNGGMATASSGTYTAKLTDGPLEGKTITIQFLDSGDPQPRLEIPADSGKRYLYARGAGLEFEGEGSERPTAVDYRYLEALFE
jgi:hypothetical protein